jgi:pimeloyl-ACP methyl ester carboxylesterase
MVSLACATPAPPVQATRPPRTIQLTPCRVPQSAEPVLCGTHSVFENRAAQTGRRIALKIVVIPARGPSPVADPVFVLVGGPGFGAASTVNGDTEWFSDKFRSKRDIVFVDQRGTGGSHRLPCPFGDSAVMQTHFNELFPVQAVRACRDALRPLGDVTLYTTPIAMDDLDEIRVALGYDRINLYGASYGAQAALQYLRQYPARVRSVVIAGVATPAAKQPLSFARAAHHAMNALLDDCAADTACRASFPDLRAEFQAVLAALDTRPATFEVVNPTTHVKESVSMSRGAFVERLRLMLYDLDRASHVPLLVHRAAQGDWVPFAISTSAGVTPGVSAMYLTVTCSETVPRITEDDIVRETRGTFVGDYRTRTHVRACREWPRSEVPAAYYEPVASDVPVLILSGELDAATPPDLASTAARSLPNSRHILIRNAAHAYRHECPQRLAAEFLSAGSARDLDAACVQQMRRPPFVVR